MPTFGKKLPRFGEKMTRFQSKMTSFRTANCPLSTVNCPLCDASSPPSFPARSGRFRLQLFVLASFSVNPTPIAERFVRFGALSWLRFQISNIGKIHHFAKYTTISEKRASNSPPDSEQ
jgi:hypothetical protein